MIFREGGGGANKDECPRHGELFEVEIVNEKGEDAEHDGRGEKLAYSDQVKDEGWVERGLFGDFGSGSLKHDERGMVSSVTLFILCQY